jgi:hypothetical protein
MSFEAHLNNMYFILTDLCWNLNFEQTNLLPSVTYFPCFPSGLPPTGDSAGTRKVSHPNKAKLSLTVWSTAWPTTHYRDLWNMVQYTRLSTYGSFFNLPSIWFIKLHTIHIYAQNICFTKADTSLCDSSPGACKHTGSGKCVRRAVYV